MPPNSGSSGVRRLAVYDDAKGIFHPYYAVVMAPAVAALAGAGAVALWRLGRQSLRWAWLLPAAVVGTVLWADALLARTSGYESWVRPTVVVTGVVVGVVVGAVGTDVVAGDVGAEATMTVMVCWTWAAGM